EEYWLPPTLPNGLAHSPDGALQGGIADEQLRPDGPAQFFLGDGTAMGCQQVREGLEHFAAQTNHLAGAVQDAALHVEFTVSKDIDHGGVFRLVPGRRQPDNRERPRPW